MTAAKLPGSRSFVGGTSFLIEQSYGPKVTRLDRGVMGRAPGQDGAANRTGPIRSAGVPFTVVAGTPLIIAAMNPYRRGLKLQNKDTVEDLFYSFGPLADATCAFLTPRATLLLDFICPTDQVSVFAVSANISGHFDDYSNSPS